MTEVKTELKVTASQELEQEVKKELEAVQADEEKSAAELLNEFRPNTLR